jgi:dTDP-4-amino-4,6-dideoxy-D-galactose acyltransferase
MSLKLSVQSLKENNQDYYWSLDPFDSEVFGFNVAKIKYIRSDNNSLKIVDALIADFKKHKIEYAVYRIPADNYNLIHSLERNEFVLVDGLINLKIDIREQIFINNINIRPSNIQDLKTLQKLAKTSFKFNRVFNDSVLDKHKAGMMYALWIENSLKGEAADAVFIWEENNEILGFITLQKNGHIPLLAVDDKARGKGIAKSLINAVLQQFRDWGVKTSEIETQMANIPALRAYSACGYKINNSQLTFRWSNK